MKLVFGGAFALIALGVVLYFTGANTSWVVFCISLGVGIILMGIPNSPITFWIGIGLLIIAGIALLIALNETNKQRQTQFPQMSLFLVQALLAN